MWSFPREYPDPYLYPQLFWMPPPQYDIPSSIHFPDPYTFTMAPEIQIENTPLLKQQEDPIQVIAKEDFSHQNNDSEKAQFEGEDQNQDDQRGSRRQKSGRNIFSNIFRSFLRYLNSQTFQLIDFRKIINKHGYQITQSQFRKKVLIESQKLKSYVRKREIQDFFALKSSTDKEYNSCIRAALFFYVKCKHQMEIFHSKKIRKDFRKVHLQELRKFLLILRQRKSPQK